MSTDLVLHYAPDNASLIIRLALEECGLPFRTALVDRSTREQDSASYRLLNPNGLIPVLETPQGTIFETGAILLWLADRTDCGLGPKPDATERGAFLKWLFFLSNTVHADLRQLFYPELYVPPEAIPGHHALLTARLRRHFSILDKAAQDELFLLPSALALYTLTLMRWSMLYPEARPTGFRISDHPALYALGQALDQRPSARKAATAEGLGPHPFSAPALACPPVGSAT